MARPFALKEKLLRYFCEISCGFSEVAAASITLGNGVTVCPEICRRFGAVRTGIALF